MRSTEVRQRSVVFAARGAANPRRHVLGALAKLFGVKANVNAQKTTQNSNTNIDTLSAGRTQNIWDAAQGAAGAGPSPLVTGAAGYNDQMMRGGNLGFSAYTGNPQAAQQFMDPYQQQVIDANNAGWQKTNAQTQNQVNDRATAAGAFGGSRHGVMAGVAQSNNNMAQQQQTAGLLSQGFQGAMDRAGNAAQMGFQAGGANAGLGMQGVGSPEQWRMQMLKQGYLGPQGQQSSGAQTTFGGNLGFG